MPTARLTVLDAPACKTIADAAVAETRAFWPGSVSSFDLAVWENLVQLGGWKVTANNGAMRGFIITPERPVPVGPNSGERAEEMFIWYAAQGLSNAVFASSTKELWTAWWTDLRDRGIPFGWGRNAPQYPTRTETLFQNAITRGGMQMITSVEDGVAWRYVVMRPPDALAGLARL